MWPGFVTKISEANLAAAATIVPQTDLIRINDTTSTTVLTTITPPGSGFPTVLMVQNRSGASITTVTTGNILTAVTIGDKALVLCVYSVLEGKWIVGALA